VYLLRNLILESEFKIFNEIFFCCAIPKKDIEIKSGIRIVHISKFKNNKTMKEIIAMLNRS
jgi:hypothetical protein